MGKRHSKNNTALAVFTYAEKQKLKGIYGTLSSRLGRDSQKPFDSCSLCLSTARSPMVCNEGHLFCKLKETAEKEKEKEKEIQDFIDTETRVTSSSSKQEKIPLTGAKEKGSFWMPEKPLKNDTETVLEPESKGSPMCLSAKTPHPIGMKKLTAVIFNEIDGKISCPVCINGFTLGKVISVLKGCGHCICKVCADKFVLRSSKCPVCEHKCKPNHIIAIITEGTGFAAKGGAEADRATLAFQC